MKELEVTVQVRNNRLKERRLALGMNQPDFAKTAGVSLHLYRDLELLRLGPRTDAGEWRKIAVELARFHCVEPEDLFPPTTQAVKQAVVVRKVDGRDVYPLLSSHQTRALAAPSETYDDDELRAQIALTLTTLSPEAAQVLRLRHGLGGHEPHTIEDAAAELGWTAERLRRVEERALRDLRHPHRANKLRVFVDGDRPQAVDIASAHALDGHCGKVPCVLCPPLPERAADREAVLRFLHDAPEALREGGSASLPAGLSHDLRTLLVLAVRARADRR